MNSDNWYKEYYYNHYKYKNKKRDDILVNREVLFQFLARKKCFINSLTEIPIDKNNCKIADIGCGSCTDLMNLVTLGFHQQNLYGIDINKNDIDFGLKNFPLLNLTNQDASNLNFKDNFFDLVYESTMFVQLNNDKVSQRISNEMLRVTKKNFSLAIKKGLKKCLISEYLQL